MLNNGIFTYEEKTAQSVHVDNNYYAFHNGYIFEQKTKIHGDAFFNSVLKKTLEEYDVEYEVYGKVIYFKTVLEEEGQEFEETPGFMVLEKTKTKIAKIIEGYPVEEIFNLKEESEALFQGFIDYHYDY